MIHGEYINEWKMKRLDIEQLTHLRIIKRREGKPQSSNKMVNVTSNKMETDEMFIEKSKVLVNEVQKELQIYTTKEDVHPLILDELGERNEHNIKQKHCIRNRNSIEKKTFFSC